LSQTGRPRQASGYGQDVRRRCVGVVMENQPTLAYVCQKRTRAGPKMGMDPGPACTLAQDCTQKGPGVKHRPKVTQNGHMERGNPSRALSGDAGEGDQAASRDGVGCPKKRMPGVMPRIC
jgi:hypothetical protein